MAARSFSCKTDLTLAVIIRYNFLSLEGDVSFCVETQLLVKTMVTISERSSLFNACLTKIEVAPRIFFSAKYTSNLMGYNFFTLTKMREKTKITGKK